MITILRLIRIDCCVVVCLSIVVVALRLVRSASNLPLIDKVRAVASVVGVRLSFRRSISVVVSDGALQENVRLTLATAAGLAQKV